MPSLPNARAVVFDAYGTLFDVASAAQAARDALGEAWQPLAELWRAKQLQYTWLRSLMGRHADFWQVTGEALDFALESQKIADRPLRQRLMDLYERLGAYPEVPAVLSRLRAAGLRPSILSNGTPRMLATAAQSAGISQLLEATISVEEVGIYKPHPSVYRLATERLRLPAQDIVFVSSNGWDVCGAKAFGLRVVWCNRSLLPADRVPEPHDAQIRTLDELPALLGL